MGHYIRTQTECKSSRGHQAMKKYQIVKKNTKILKEPEGGHRYRCLFQTNCSGSNLNKDKKLIAGLIS